MPTSHGFTFMKVIISAGLDEEFLIFDRRRKHDLCKDLCRCGDRLLDSAALKARLP